MRPRILSTMSGSSQALDVRRRVGVGLLGLVVVGAGLAVGALDTPILMLAAALLFAAFALVSWGSEHVPPRRAAAVVFWTGAALTAFTLLQMVPLPAGLVRVIAPYAADIWDRCLRPLGEGPRAWMTLSLDPTATRIEVIRGVAYVTAFAVAARIAARSTGSVALHRIVILGAVIVTLSAAIHLGFDAKRLYGFYLPRTGVGAVVPLFNPNHLAGFINIGLLVAFASVISPNPVAPRPLLATAVLGLTAAEAWIASRGAIGAMIFGMVVVVAFTFKLRRGRDTMSWVAPVILGVSAIAGGIVMAIPAIAPMLFDTDVSKLEAPVNVLRTMVPHYPIWGVGRGAFESTYAEFRPGVGFFVWTHPENFVAQWTSEWGLPVSIAGFAALAWALRPRVVFMAARPAIGPWAALVATALHNLVDFNSEVPAVIFSCALCAAMVTSGSVGAKGDGTGWSAPRNLVGALGVATALAIVLGWTRGGELLDDRERLMSLARPGATDSAGFHATLRVALLEHPAEPYFPYLGAARASWARDESPIPWIDRTLERAPIYPEAHLLLARFFRRYSASQARLEYRIYEEQAGDTIVMNQVEVEPLIGSYEDAMDLVPAGPKGPMLLELFAARIADRLPATRARIDVELVRRNPDASGALLRIAHDAMLDAKDAPWCEDSREACIAEAIRTALIAEHAAPDHCAGYEAHARALALSGREAEAFVLLHQAQTALDEHERVPCLQVAVDLALESNSEGEATAAVDAIAKTSCGALAACTDHLVAAATIEQRRGRGARALAFLRRAHVVAPEDDGVTERLAMAASTSGLHVESAQLYEDLAHRHPNEPRFGGLARDERARLDQSPLPN